jgi:hypothetical protein
MTCAPGVDCWEELIRIRSEREAQIRDHYAGGKIPLSPGVVPVEAAAAPAVEEAVHEIEVEVPAAVEAQEEEAPAAVEEAAAIAEEVPAAEDLSEVVTGVSAKPAAKKAKAAKD